MGGDRGIGEVHEVRTGDVARVSGGEEGEEEDGTFDSEDPNFIGPTLKVGRTGVPRYFRLHDALDSTIEGPWTTDHQNHVIRWHSVTQRYRRRNARSIGIIASILGSPLIHRLDDVVGSGLAIETGIPRRSFYSDEDNLFGGFKHANEEFVFHAELILEQLNFKKLVRLNKFRGLEGKLTPKLNHPRAGVLQKRIRSFD